jgi:hypothetical protein
MEQALSVRWVDAGKEPRCPPNPKHPNGIDVDMSNGAARTCTVDLPYPAKRIGAYVITCKTCGCTFACTTAGRPDDPRSAKVPCFVRQMQGEPTP